MELRVLNYFLMAAREENITKAAQLLHVTQPTLSRQLMQLEEELGVKLFQRSNHCIVLTEEGMLLKRRAQELVSLAEKTRQDLMQKDTELTGEISIGCGELQSVDFLAKLLARFQVEHPLVQMSIFSSNTDSIKERIENGTLDIGLFPEPVDISRYEFIRVPVREEWGVLTQEDSPLGRLPFVRPENLVGRPLMISGREMVQHELANWFGDEFQKLDISVRYNLLYNVAMLVRNGFGDALCIRLDCQYPGLRFVPLHPPLAFGSVLVWKKHQVAFPAVSALIVHAKKCLSGILEHME